MNQQDKKEIEQVIESKINDAIEIRKKQVQKQFRVWGASISAVFSFLLIIGFTTDDIIGKIREKILPRDHLISNLLINDNQSNRLKENILSELNNPDLESYTKVKSTISANVWETLETSDPEEINEFLSQSEIDDAIIRAYYAKINQILFSPAPDNMDETVETIIKLGSNPEPVRIGVFRNANNAKTNCNLLFRQNRKRVILYFPPSTKIRGENALPFYQCPNNYPQITVSLTIEDVTVDGIMVVGVERPTSEDNIRGVRARVSNAVGEEFLAKEINLGSAVTSGFLKVTDVSEN